LRFTAGEDHILDERLVSCDVRASIAHAQMLAAQGLLSAADGAAICAGLEALEAAHARGEWRIELGDEDGQTALERRLTARIGAAGARIHLGRSRNDQVLAALRLYMREALAQLATGAEAVAAALDRLSQRQGTIALPGYTHMQQAMPSSVALWAGGYAAEIRDDAEGLRAVQRRAGRNPLGSAAGYGTPGLPLDRHATTRALGFDSTQEPVTAVQLSRGKAEAQLLFETTLLMQDLAARRRPAAVLHAGIRLCRAARGLHHRLLDHAAEAQSGCLRTAARPGLQRIGLPDGGPVAVAPSSLPVTSATCSCSRRPCSVASTCVNRAWTSSCPPWTHCNSGRNA